MSFDSVSLSVQALVPLEIALANLVLCLYILLRRWLDDTTGRLFVAYLFLTTLWNVNLAVGANALPAPTAGFTWTQLACYGLIVLGISLLAMCLRKKKVYGLKLTITNNIVCAGLCGYIAIMGWFFI